MPLSGLDEHRVDIAIITQNRKHEFDLTLDTLEAALLFELKRVADLGDSEVRFGIWLGLNGTSPEREAEIRNRLHELRKSLRIVDCNLVRLPESRPASARNSLLRYCNAEWIFFCDDDIVIPENFFAEFEILRWRYPEARLIGGANINPAQIARQFPNISANDPKIFEENWIQQAQGIVLASPFVAGPMSARYREPDRSADGIVGLETDEFGLGLILCNLFWRRNQKIDPFDEDVICGEELELIDSMTGPHIRSRALTVGHWRRSSLRRFFAQAIKYGVGRAEMSWWSGGVAWAITLVFAFLPLKIELSLLLLALMAQLVASYRCFRAQESTQAPGVPLKFWQVAIVGVILQWGYFLGICLGSIAPHWVYDFKIKKENSWRRLKV